MTIALIPETAPFNAEQRAWLNGFFAGLLGMADASGNSADLSAVAAGLLGGALPGAAAVAEDEEFPWHDPGLDLEERLALAEGQPHARRLMAAMAQLDCGACGYVCQTYAEALARGEEGDLTRCSPGGGVTAKKLKELIQLYVPGEEADKVATSITAKTALPAAKTETPTYSRQNPFTAKLLESRRLTHQDAPKDTRHVVIDLQGSGLTYEPGDALGILPLNCPELVAGIIRALHTSGEELIPTPDGGAKRLHEALASDYLLTRPRAQLLETLAKFSTNSDESKHLEKLLADGPDDFLATVDVLDILTRYPHARPPLVEFVATLGKLQPRLYSISSSQRMHPDEVHLTVGVVRYESQGKWFHGVASNFLGTRSEPGAPVRVFVQKSPRFRLPSDPSTPIIMVGPGTGIAPFRSFLEECAATGARRKSWLIFGNQYIGYDFLYRDELTQWCESGVLTKLDLAFSRDTAEKVYVQDRMRQQGEQLWQWLQSGAYFYVCGDAKKMAPDVDQALQDIAIHHGGLSAAEAKAFIQKLVREKRYLKDVY